MERLPSNDLSRLRSFLEETAVPCNLETFGSLVLPAVQKLVPSVVVCYAQIDPERQAMVAQETHPSLPYEDNGSFEEYMAEHPVFQAWARTSDASAGRTSDFYSTRQWHESGLYQNVYRLWGCEDSLAIGLPAPQGLIACICSERDTPFTDRELLLMNLVRPHLAQAYRSAELFSLLGAPEENQGLATMIVDRRGRPLFAPEAAWRLIEEYFPDTAGQSFRLPETLSEWLTAQLSRLARRDEVPTAISPLVVQQRDGGSLTLRVLLGRSTGERAVIALREEVRAGGVMAATELGLTSREQEILLEARRGSSSAEIGDILCISRRTVEKHLENIYSKLNVNSRNAAVARAFFESETRD